jgi:phosphopantetheine adenylyltransferase
LSLDQIQEKVQEILNPKTVVFSGSFDPWTYGHEAVVRDYLKMNSNSKVKIII